MADPITLWGMNQPPIVWINIHQRLIYIFKGVIILWVMLTYVLKTLLKKSIKEIILKNTSQAFDLVISIQIFIQNYFFLTP